MDTRMSLGAVALALPRAFNLLFTLMDS